MFWVKKDLKYEILIPPLSKPFDQLTKKEAQQFFDWYMATMDGRIAYLKIASGLKLDYSPDSLIPLWKWFLKKAEIEVTPQASLQALEAQLRSAKSPFVKEVLADRAKQLSLETEYILQDIARYFGEVYVKNYPFIHWGFYSTPKREMNVNQPVLMGFPNKIFPEKKGVPLPPLHVVRVRALRLLSSEASKYDLYDLFNIRRP